MLKKRKVVQGWRIFYCDDCGHIWKETSRDAASPSGDTCPNCSHWVTPGDYELDPTIPIDEQTGNLIKNECKIVQHGISSYGGLS